MAKPEIIWAFLPNGIKNGKLRFSAAVSIRLPEGAGSGPNLGLFPEVLNWAGTVKDMTFDLQFEKGAPIEARRVSPDPDQELWQAIFQPDSPVEPFKFPDLTRNAVFAYPVKHVQSFIAQQYINVAAESPDEPPVIEKLFRNEALGQIRLRPTTGTRFASVVQARTTEKVMAQRVRSNVEGRKIRAVESAAKPEPAQDFYLLKFCHQPKNKTAVDPITKKAVAQRAVIKPPEPDFHQAISHLANYPALMRLLGLAIDFEVDLPGTFPAAGSLVKVVPRGREDTTPWTKFKLNPAKGLFAADARSSKPEAVDGFLDLSDEDKFDIVQLDVDGAALKTAALADQAERTDSGDLPALRSNGLSVIRTGNALYLAEAFKIAFEKNALFQKKKELVFYAEDLTQGYRIDVWDEESKGWHSLCRRTGTYNFLRNGRELVLEDEGFTSECMTQAADGSSDDIFTHESIFSWNGWSLVAERPGRTIDSEDKAADIQSRAATAFRLETKFKPVAGSLPKLRFGNRYRLRARTVDLAGNGLGPETNDGNRAIPAPSEEPVQYARFDPIPSPVVVLRNEPKRGETVDTVVIRSLNDSIEKDSVATGETAERHIVPPKTSQLGAETHGMFDAPGGGPRKDLYAAIAAKDPGQLKEVEPEEEVDLPYFPDPWAKGVLIRGLPGFTADKPLRIEFSGDWPDLRSFKLRAEEGDRAAEWSESSRILTVYLKKSDMVTLRFSCWFPEPVLPKLGLYKWLEKPQAVIPAGIQQAPQATSPILVVPAGLEPVRVRRSVIEANPLRPGVTAKAARVQAQPEAAQVKAQTLRPVFQLPRIDLNLIKRIAVDGAHWMMTPYRTVTLIHAVQQPIGLPGAKRLGVVRGLGETHAAFDAELEVHGSSSQKFDLAADWKEPVDNIAEKTWRTIDGSAHVLEQHLERGTTSFLMNSSTGHRHEFGDTRYRKVNYTMTATTRFKEQMPAETVSNVELLIRKSIPLAIDVPNAAPPAMPKVRYVVPTFGWERKRELGKFTSIRKGGGLRVYLDRPWFSSGDGELLGVVLAPTPGVPGLTPAMANVRTAALEGPAVKTGTKARTTAAVPDPVQVKSKVQVNASVKATALLSPTVPEELRPYVSLWGMDPLWRAGLISTPEYPLPQDFTLAEGMLGGLPLPEMPGTSSFTAVGHRVEFDEDRGLWFCDIDIDPHDAYFPFVRLALARFQPISVFGAHLSKVVTADFIQLAPDRAVSLTFNRSNLKEMNITVSGASYVQAAAGSGPGQIEVSLETRSLALPEELGWTEVPRASVILSPQRASKAEPGNFIWSGKLTLPKEIKLKACRVALREYETFVSDEVDRSAKKAATMAAMPLKRVQRLVFAETFPLFDL